MLKPGTVAPAFQADSTRGTVDLSEHLGNRPIVLIFYPGDFTPICTAQLCAVRDSSARYAEYDALVLGINPAGMEKHLRFSETYGYDFPLVADAEGAIRQLYDVGKVLGLFMQNRIVYVIGKSGKIAYAKSGNPPSGELLHVLAEDAERR